MAADCLTRSSGSLEWTCFKKGMEALFLNSEIESAAKTRTLGLGSKRDWMTVRSERLSLIFAKAKRQLILMGFLGFFFINWMRVGMA